MTKKIARTLIYANCAYIHIPSFIELLRAEKEDWKNKTAETYIDRLLTDLTKKVEEAKNA